MYNESQVKTRSRITLNKEQGLAFKEPELCCWMLHWLVPDLERWPSNRDSISSGLLVSHHCDIYNIVYKQFLPHCLIVSFWSRGVRFFNLITEIQNKQLISSRWEKVLVSPSHATSCECLKLLTEFKVIVVLCFLGEENLRRNVLFMLNPKCWFVLSHYDTKDSMTVKANWMRLQLNPYLMCVMSDNGSQEYVESRKYVDAGICRIKKACMGSFMWWKRYQVEYNVMLKN